MTPTPQLRKIVIRKRASHPSSSRELNIDFPKLVSKLEQAEIFVKQLEEAENSRLQYVNNIQTPISKIINIQDSDNELAKNHPDIKHL